MKYIGLFLFFVVFLAFFLFGQLNDFILDTFNLAPEITTLVAVFYIYVSLLALYLSFFKVKNAATLFIIHTKMSCTVMVSLGLVGTFIGLVDMIGGIAGALGSDEPDFAKKMQTLLSAISSSLSAMSFAFITSILGVGVSAYVMVASTFVSTDLRKSAIRDKEADQNNLVDNKDTAFLAQRLSDLENLVMELKVNQIESEITPALLVGSLDRIAEQLKGKNEEISSQVKALLEVNQNMQNSMLHQYDLQNKELHVLDDIYKEISLSSKEMSKINETSSETRDLVLTLSGNLVNISNVLNTYKEKLRLIFSH